MGDDATPNSEHLFSSLQNASRTGIFAVLKSIKTPSQVRTLLKQHSPFWIRRLDRHPEDITWLLDGAPLDQEHTIRHLETSWRKTSWNSMKSDETLAVLRKIKWLEMLRITVRDLACYAHLETTVAELSALADFCLQHALDSVFRETISKYGRPQAKFAIIGLGKLGGQELNYSSDIDLIFVYSEEGSLENLSYHHFFNHIAEKIMRGFRPNEEEGSLFRIDLRLRPEGHSGPVTRSLESYENYYAAFGEVWERMALQKARFIAGDAELGYEFIQHLQPFCFPKHLPASALDEIYQIKIRIESEILKEGGLDRHVKLGRGGIREIEFAVQALQLLHGSRHAFSQEPGTLKLIRALHRLNLIDAKDATSLMRAYLFLRRLEHRLQMREDRQTHMVPEDSAAQMALARGLGFKSHSAFENEWKTHIEFVRSFFHRIIRPSSEKGSASSLTDGGSSLSHYNRLVREAGFSEPEKAAETLEVLARGPIYAHVSQRTHNLFQQLLPYLLKTSRRLARPDFALQQFERFIEAYGSRASLYELLVSNPKILELLFKLFDHSQFLTDIIVRQPSLLESIAHEGLLVAPHDRKKMETDLAQQTAPTLEGRLRSFRGSELLRIALRDILGLSISQEETFREISQLADVCLAEAIRVIGKAPPFCVIALGKYGGEELSYGSDLDIVFVGGSVEIATRVIATMSQEDEDGIVFKMDARLRPDGEDGPLTLPIESYMRYYEKRAQFWERQALARARFVAGNHKIGLFFLKFVQQTIYSRPARKSELKELWAMRKRIERERGDSADPARDFKTGVGGLVDIEFLIQAWQLFYGAEHSSLRTTSTMDVLRALPGIGGWQKKDSDLLIKDYQWLRKLESVLRCFRNTSISQLPSSRKEWIVPARHLGLKNAVALEKDLMFRRNRIRSSVDRLKKLMRP